MNTDWQTAYSIPSLINLRVRFPGELLYPAPGLGQAGGPQAACRNLQGPGGEHLNPDKPRCRREARFRTSPGLLGLPRIELPFRPLRDGHSHTGQPGAIHIALDRPHAAGALVRAQIERLLFKTTTPMASLGQSQLRRQGMELGASLRGFALQCGDKRGRSGQAHRLAKLALQPPVRVLLYAKIVADSQNRVDELPMLAIPERGSFAMPFGQPGFSPPLLVRDGPLLTPRPRAPIGQIVVGVVRPATTVDLALQFADLALGGLQRGAQVNLRAPCLAGDAKHARARINSNLALANRMLRFAVGRAGAHQLRPVAGLAPQPAAHQTHILDGSGQAMRHNGIVSGNMGWHAQFAVGALPHDLVITPANALGVGLAFDGVQLVAAFEPWAAPLAKILLANSLGAK